MCVGKALTGGYLTARGGAVHAAGGRGASRAGEVPVLAHGPDLHGQPAGLRGRQRLASSLLLAGDWRAEVARIEAGLRGRSGAAARARRAWRTCGCSARSAWCSSTTPVDVPAATAAAVARGRVAAPVPGPDLHHAAVRDRRRGPVRPIARGDAARRSSRTRGTRSTRAAVVRADPAEVR